MTNNELNIWPKQITVDKRIVKILSESTYENFPNALKEVIVNSYDAKATTVKITIDLNREKIVILDNGTGMSESDFDFFIRIAGKTRQREEIINSRRKIIGQFGVGFVSIFPFFENYDIETKKSGKTEILNANIPCFRYFVENKKTNVKSDIGSIDITGQISYNQTVSEEHYTKTTLTGFTRLTKNFFYPVQDQPPRKNSIHKKDGLEKLVWKLEEDLPILYEEENYNVLFKEVFSIPKFEVFVNEKPLYRRVWGNQLLETHQQAYKQFGKIKVKYFIATAGGVIKPNEAKHLKIRNLNVGVGDRTAFGMGEEVGGFRSKVNWLTGEIHILDGMNDLIKVSRDGFNFSSDYEKLKDFFISRLSFHSTRLEKEKEVTDFVASDELSTKVKNIRLLEPDTLQNKITQLRQKTINDNDSNIVQDRFNLELDKFNSATFKKTISLNKKKYNLISRKWNYKNDVYPACKIEGNTIVLNKDYPLFKKKSQTDFFVKLHYLLLVNYSEGNIDKGSYEKLTKDVIGIFNDYL
ncbi:MAG: ATP-binding protein [Ignavibacterium sp.]|nr:ATP-binding protein [Ignavibacterium sp.]